MTFSSPTEKLSNRYGVKSKNAVPKWVVPLIAGLGLTAAILLTVWFAWSAPASHIEHKLVSYRVISDSQIELTVAITMDRNKSAVCGLEALSQSKSVAGYKQIEVPAGKDRMRVIKTVVETTEPSGAGLISYCWVE